MYQKTDQLYIHVFLDLIIKVIKMNIEELNIDNTKKDKMVILFASDSPYYPTGFAKQLGGVAQYISENTDHEIHFLGWQTRGNIKDERFDYVIHGGKNEPYGIDAYEGLFDAINPDVVITLGDAHMTPLNRMNHPFWIGYFPLDGHPISSNILSVISQMDMRIAMADYGLQLCLEHKLHPTEFIPHFVETDIFKPIDKKKCRKEMKGFFTDINGEVMDIPEDAFIIGSVARLNPRKHNMRLLQAFKDFIDNIPDEDKKNVYLYLHLDPKDPLFLKDKNHDYMFLEMVNTFGIDDRVIFTKNNYFLEGLSIEEMIRLYNVFDIHAIATGGEGFGVPTIEAMSCGVPSIITDYTTSKELVGIKSYDDPVLAEEEEQRGILVPYEKLYLEKAEVHKAWIDIPKMAKAFNKYYMDRELLKKHSENCRNYAIKTFDREVVLKQWLDLINKITFNVKIKLYEEMY